MRSLKGPNSIRGARDAREDSLEVPRRMNDVVSGWAGMGWVALPLPSPWQYVCVLSVLRFGERHAQLASLQAKDCRTPEMLEMQRALTTPPFPG